MTPVGSKLMFGCATSRPPRLIRTLLAFVTALMFVLMSVGAATPALAADGDAIDSYRIDYTVDADGTVHSRETITYSFGPGTRRGIFAWYTTRRDLDEQPGYYRLYDFTVNSVSSPSGAPAQYELSTINGSERLRIGDPERTISGTQTYVIDTTVKGVVNGIDSNGKHTQELYLNPVGFSWEASIRDVTVTLKTPAVATAQQCFVGPYQSKNQSGCQISAQGDTLTFAVATLNRSDGVSINGSYPAGTFSDETPIILAGSASGDPNISEVLSPGAQTALSAGGYLAGVGILAATVVSMTMLHRRRGRDEQYVGLTPGVMPVEGTDNQVQRGGAKAPVAVRFEPPEQTKPGLIGVLVDESADTVDVSATLIDLAVRGYLRIEEVKSGLRKKDDWRLVRTEPQGSESVADLLAYERKLYDRLFRDGDEVRLSKLKNTFATTLDSVTKGMYRQVVSDGWFANSPQKVRSHWGTLGFILSAVGGVSLLAPLFLGIGYGSAGGITIALLALSGCVMLAGLVVIIFAGQMPARTARGSAMLAQSRGFEQYLATAEANQIRFEEAANVFSRYLPYAVVYGLSERWAQTFDDVRDLAQASGIVIDVPSWYVFYGTHSIMNFAALSSGIDSFATTAAGTFVSLPASATSSTPGASGGSGFSMGGGFSGGGGFGGGGGGSW